MAKSFFKNLVVMENVVLSDVPTLLQKDGTYVYYSDKAKQLVVDIRSWLLNCDFTKSKTSRFICQNYNKTCEDITNMWNRTAKKPKNIKTFSSQISTLSSHLYTMLGSDCFDIIIRDDAEKLDDVRLRLNLFTEDITFTDYPIEMFKYYVSENYSGKEYTLEECEQEIKMLKTLRRSTLTEYMEKADKDKLAYLKILLNTPLLNQHTKRINDKKMELIKLLDTVEGESYADIVVSYLKDKEVQAEESKKDFDTQLFDTFGMTSKQIKELIANNGIKEEKEETRVSPIVEDASVKVLKEKKEREDKLSDAYDFLPITEYIMEIGKYHKLNRNDATLSSDKDAFADEMRIFTKHYFEEVLNKYTSKAVLDGLHELRKQK